MASSDVEHWQCDKSILESLAYMLNNKIMCDVTFLLGEKQKEVHAHKCILASRSPVFHGMLNGSTTENGKIEIDDIDHETFQLFLEYVYTDDISLTVDKVISTMFVAKKYCVDRLTSQCRQFVQENILSDSNNVFTFLDEALRFSDEEVLQSCLQRIKQYTYSCIHSPKFISISKESLRLITELDKITIGEESLYEGVLKWCEAECERQYLAVTWMNKRNVLGDMRFNIRFPAMEARYFAEHVASTDLLTAVEKVEIFTYHTLQRQEDLKYFNKHNREKSFCHQTDDEDTFSSSDTEAGEYMDPEKENKAITIDTDSDEIYIPI